MGARSAVLQSLGRVAILLAWALVGWGALLVASALVSAAGEGVTAAFARLLPNPGASLWGWLGPLSVLLALGAGLAGGAFVLARRWQGGKSPEE